MYVCMYNFKTDLTCAKLFDILKKVCFIVFRRVTCFGISPVFLMQIELCCDFEFSCFAMGGV